MNKPKDLSKSKMGLLTPIRIVAKKGTNIYWLCRCDCGNTKEVTRAYLTRNDGFVKSCGCSQALSNKNRCWTGHEGIPGGIWNNIKKNAEIRNIEFNISIEEAWLLFLKQGKKCELTGIELSFALSSSKKCRTNGTASLDRIDYTKDYSLGNVQWVHKIINIMKHKLNNQEFVDWCRKVVRYDHSKDLG